MSDDLDDLLRAAMKTLDDQVPSGYFEGLPDRTLMRLEDSSMQTQGTSDNSSPTGAPPSEDGARDEDSGLHDIRSMASSAKMRISSKRVTTNPPIDDDILASSSAGWKAVALPEPAKMVSLPEIDQLEPAPSSERKSKKELKAERASASKIAREAIAVETSQVMPALGSPAPAPSISAPASAPAAATPIVGPRLQQPQPNSRTGLYAMLGVGLAAAAGVGWYVSTQMKSKDSSSNLVAASDDQAEAMTRTQPAAAPAAGSATVTAIVEPTPPPPPAEPQPDEAAVATGMSAGAGADDAKSADDEGAKRRTVKAVKQDKDRKREEVGKPAPVEKKPEPPKDVAKGDGKKTETPAGEGEPSFDALLKEAGVQDKKPVKVKLDKKSLSGADIKKGMGAISAKAQACYAGQQGTAQVKLTVAPDGTVQKVAVTGVFAGTPVSACIASAVKSATFPQWDGGPQSFGYSYLLAE